MINLPPERLKDILIKTGAINEELFVQLEAEAKRKKQNLIEILVSQNLFTYDYMLSLLANVLGVERVKLSAEKIDENVLHFLTEDTARRLKTIPFQKDADGYVYVAMEDPTNLETLDFLTLRLGEKIKTFLATDDDLNRGFALYEKKLTKDFKAIIDESIQASLRSKSKDINEAASELPIVAIVDNLIAYALSLRTSDIHFEALEDEVMIRYRIDGILHEIIRMPKEIHAAVVARLKILSSLRVDEHNKPQDGRFRYTLGQELIDIRVSILPTFYGEKVVMRLLAAAQKPISMNQLGLLDDSAKMVEEAVKKTYGMLLVCGPTGSGKTTTLYSILNILNRPEVNIITVEDPIEYDIRYVNQVQVNPAAGITFAAGLKSILRQDPNIIMVGEIRDSETANIAVQAALTGHLVLSSLHTNDAVTTIPRLIDMDIPPFLVAAVLNVISAQRLVRKVHLDCVESYAPAPDIYQAINRQLGELGLDPASIHLPKLFYHGRGCHACGYTGFLGRIGIFEVLNVSENVRKLIISKDFSLDALKKVARQEGMLMMFEDGLRKVERGLTTIEEVFRVIRE
ncbi:MAG: GspE/PulE family protein [bacterium]|nr:GspE/PulE family protein [bacterium]